MALVLILSGVDQLGSIYGKIFFEANLAMLSGVEARAIK